MDHQINTLLVPSASDALLLFAGGQDTPHSSPSQMGGPLAPLTTGAELETPNASTVPLLPIKAHPSTLLAGGWSGRAPSGDRFLREG